MIFYMYIYREKDKKLFYMVNIAYSQYGWQEGWGGIQVLSEEAFRDSCKDLIINNIAIVNRYSGIPCGLCLLPTKERNRFTKWERLNIYSSTIVDRNKIYVYRDSEKKPNENPLLYEINLNYEPHILFNLLIELLEGNFRLSHSATPLI